MYCSASAAAYVLIGALDTAYDLANQCLDETMEGDMLPGAAANDGGEVLSSYSLWDPDMRPLRSDPRFQAYVTRLGLMDYWRVTGPPDDCDLSDGKLGCH